MRFDIEKLIQFDTENATLVNQLTGDSIELSLTSSRLLAKLLSHHRDVLSREEIFQSVFDQFGARSSNSNLNQYISILRKNIAELGIEKEVIVTIPRVGFRISECVAISAFDEQPTDVVLINNIKTKTKSNYINTQSLLVFLFILIAFIFVLLAPQKSAQDTVLKKIHHGKCVIFIGSAFSEKDIQNIINTTTQNAGRLDCSTEKEVYVDKLQINSALGTNSQMLFIECSLFNNKCTSYYFREKNNA